ncbi:MAG TPA: type IV toxin-antitoxin system AbiEi family antitoxin domain-containing protein [Armatimonadota bacterium]|nr:type IV toxin-antitoxin system AbiEi family antitoxin domain-containing protein [Armatimonadota bacterium]HOM72323.1 type IV toxin-antitoxin system AbiEi family antitoxin domain-containing protein [Armatimonadota bacterium]
MKKRGPTASAREDAKRLIREKSGVIRTAEAIQVGVHPRTLYELRDAGELVQISRGVYRLTDQQPVSNIDIVTVASRIPRAVICLVSALAFHDITTQIPHTISIALEKGAETPRLDYPPITVHRFSGDALTQGIQEHTVDDVGVRVYSPEKTLADCFRFRNKLGMDVVLEALRLYKARKPFDIGELLKYAKICRVENVMRPYIEAML